MTDIIFLSVPKLRLNGPILSIHLLKACVIKAGFSSKAYDFNAWFANQVKDTDLEEAWRPENNILIDWKSIQSIKDVYILYWNKFFHEKIKKDNPKIIGITAFSVWSTPNIILIVKEIKLENPNIKILVGGPALKDINVIIALAPFIDDYITGDSELSIVEYLKGNMNYPGINSSNHNNDFDRSEMPPPNYDDMDISLYKNNNPVYSIVGSRGCVRKCAFCNVPAIWPQFTWKSGKQNAQEMIYLFEKYNAKTFFFTDSLINGNMKEFMNLLREIISYKEKNKEAKWVFSGQFICREKHQIKSEMFDLMKKAGYDHVTIGIESGSEKVRKEMHKYFSNTSIEYHLQQMERVGIRMTPLMFVGFPTETDEDFEESINILNMFKKYPKVVRRVASDSPMIMTYGSGVWNNPEEYAVIDINHSGRKDKREKWHGRGHDWTSKFSNRKTRIERHYIFLNEAKKRGLWDDGENVSAKTHTMAEEYMNFSNPDKKIVNIINSWYNS